MEFTMDTARTLLPLSYPFEYDGDEIFRSLDERLTCEDMVDSYISGDQEIRGIGIAVPNHIKAKITRFVASPWASKIFSLYVSRGAPQGDALAKKAWELLIRYGEVYLVLHEDQVWVERPSSIEVLDDFRGEPLVYLYRTADDSILELEPDTVVRIVLPQPIFGVNVLRSIDRLGTILTASVLSSEVYHSPARYLINVDPDELSDIRAAIGRTIAIGPPEEGEPEAKLQELAGGDPKVFDTLLDAETRRLALAAGVPTSSLQPGLLSNMSFESSSLEERSFIDNLRMIQQILSDGLIEAGLVAPKFGFVQQQNLGAVADGLYKLILAGAISPRSEFVARLLQLTESEREDNERLLSSGSPRLQAILAGTVTDQVEADDIDG